MIWETIVISVVASVMVNLIVLYKKTHQLFDGLSELEDQYREKLVAIVIDIVKKNKKD